MNCKMASDRRNGRFHEGLLHVIVMSLATDTPQRPKAHDGGVLEAGLSDMRTDARLTL